MLENKTSSALEIAGGANEWALFRSAVVFVAGAVDAKPVVSALGAVAFDVADGSVSLVGTDRFRLHIATSGVSAAGAGASCDGIFLVNARELSKAVSARKVRAWSFEILGGRWSLVVDGSEFGGELVAGDFPKWRTLTPTELATVAPNGVSLSPAVLGETMRAFGRAFGSGVRVSFNFFSKALAPIELVCDEHGARALVMPLRGA